MRKRNYRVVVHLDKQELEHLTAQCKACGLRRENLLRQLIAGVQIKPRPPDSYRELSRALSALGNNLNQIAHRVNTADTVEKQQMLQLQNIMQKVWEEVQKSV